MVTKIHVQLTNKNQKPNAGGTQDGHEVRIRIADVVKTKQMQVKKAEVFTLAYVYIYMPYY